MTLGNTGAAVHRKWIANDVMQPLPKEYQALLKKITSMDDVTELTKLRHPDPKLTPKLELQDSELQIRGSWKKVELSKTNSIHARYSFASFVWKSRFYVCGGQKAVLGPFYLDFQYLDLKKLDRWQTLPPYPFAISKNLGVFIGFKMCVHEDKAYLFNGSTRVDYFDLIEQDWGYFDTQWVSSNGVTSFPFPQRDLVDYALAVANGKIYVFGGTHRACAIGCCLLFCLDIATRTWRLLSGAHDPLVPSYEYPGPRRHPVMWTNGKADRLYLMFGEADRPGATVARQPQGAKDGYGYDDFWSWDINAEVWRRERLAGNPPCPRSEACCTYVRVFDIIYYHASL